MTNVSCKKAVIVPSCCKNAVVVGCKKAVIVGCEKAVIVPSGCKNAVIVGCKKAEGSSTVRDQWQSQRP